MGEALEARAALGAALLLGVAAHEVMTGASRKGRYGRKEEFSFFDFAPFAAFA